VVFLGYPRPFYANSFKISNYDILPNFPTHLPPIYPSHVTIYQILSRKSVVKFAFTRCKLAVARQAPGMRAQTFRVSYGKFDRLNFEAGYSFQYSICIKRVFASPTLDSRELTCIV
jgi:hypothetical protein